MRRKANDFSLLCAMLGAVVVAQLMLALAAAAADDSESAGRKQAGEDRWVPSLAIVAGVTVQKQSGYGDSWIFPDNDPSNAEPLRDPVKGNDIVVSPFVGGSLELMTPALSIPTRPRFWISGEILPTFANSRDLAVQGDPNCVRGPEPDVPCAQDEDGTRTRGFNDTAANGQGTRVSAQVQTLVFSASVGAAFPFQVGERQLRIKPSFGWITYEVEADGLVVDANCPTGQCTDTMPFPGFTFPGVMRETTLRANGSEWFNGIGPGLDVEMDAARMGPIGASLFAGARAYYIVDNRRIKFGTVESYDDAVGTDTETARFKVEVKEWMYRAHIGIRFHWLGHD